MCVVEYRLWVNWVFGVIWFVGIGKFWNYFYYVRIFCGVCFICVRCNFLDNNFEFFNWIEEIVI